MIAIFCWILGISLWLRRYDTTSSLAVYLEHKISKASPFQECHVSDPGHDLYSRFYISGRDIAALFADCSSDYQNCTFVIPTHTAHSEASPLKSVDVFYPLIDRCGIAVIVDQVCTFFVQLE